MELVKEMTGPLLLVCIFSSLGGMNFGLDNAYWGGLLGNSLSTVMESLSDYLGMDQFKKDFGRFDELIGEYAIPTTWQSVGSGTPQAGIAIGCLMSASISKHFGRKKCFMVLATIALVGILIQITAKEFWQLFIGRMVNSVSMGIICRYEFSSSWMKSKITLASVVPIYQTECAPPAIRGAAVNFYQVSSSKVEFSISVVWFSETRYTHSVRHYVRIRPLAN